MIRFNRERQESLSGRTSRRRYIHLFPVAAFVAATMPLAAGDVTPQSASGQAGIVVPSAAPTQSTAPIIIRNQRLETTYMQYDTTPLSIPADGPVTVLPPFSVTCPGKGPCTFEFTTTAQIGSGSTSDEFWTMAASVDGVFADASFFVVSPVPTACCEQRTTELFSREIAPGPHVVQMWVVSPGASATLIYRSMVTRIYSANKRSHLEIDR
jgi:hypothetical protein